MTVLETAEKFHVAEETVINWCKKQWIRGVKKDDLGEYVIPKSVKMPYAKTRSKGDAIYTSIVKATLKGLDVWTKYCTKETKLYVLVAYDGQDERDIEGAFFRIEKLMTFGCLPYIMRFEKYNDAGVPES